MFVSVSIYVFVHPSVCPSQCLSVCLCVHVCLYTHPSVCLSLCMTVYFLLPCQFIYLYTYLFFYLSIGRLPFYLAVSPSLTSKLCVVLYFSGFSLREAKLREGPINKSSANSLDRLAAAEMLLSKT